jgi:hypothetical protein
MLATLRRRLKLNGRIVLQLSDSVAAVVGPDRILVYRFDAQSQYLSDCDLVLILTGIGRLAFLIGALTDPRCDMLSADRELLFNAGAWYPMLSDWSALCFNRRFRSLQSTKPDDFGLATDPVVYDLDPFDDQPTVRDSYPEFDPFAPFSV